MPPLENAFAAHNLRISSLFLAVDLAALCINDLAVSVPFLYPSLPLLNNRRHILVHVNQLSQFFRHGVPVELGNVVLTAS